MVFIADLKDKWNTCIWELLMKSFILKYTLPRRLQINSPPPSAWGSTYKLCRLWRYNTTRDAKGTSRHVVINSKCSSVLFKIQCFKMEIKIKGDYFNVKISRHIHKLFACWFKEYGTYVGNECHFIYPE